MGRRLPKSALFPYTTLFRSRRTSIARKVWGGTFHAVATRLLRQYGEQIGLPPAFSILDRSDSEDLMQDRKSTRLNSSHVKISYAVFCLKKKTQNKYQDQIHF